MDTKLKKSDLFNCLNKTFDKIYIITLKRSTDRHNLIKQNFKGLDYEIFWGSDARNLNFEELKLDGVYIPEIAFKENIINQVLEKGEVGCALSHTRIYECIVNNNLDNALIFEDDAFLDTENINAAINALSNIPEDWELLYFGYTGNKEKMPFKSKFRANIAYPILNFFGFGPYYPHRIRNKYYVPLKNGWEIHGINGGAYAYAISYGGAKKMIDFQSPIIMAQDNALGRMVLDRKICSYRLSAPIFSPNREIPTTIGGRVHDK